MDTQLKKLKESMDKTALKPGIISNEEKRNILKAAINGDVKRHRFYFAPVLSPIVITGLFILLGGFVYQNYFEPTPDSKQNAAIQNSEKERKNSPKPQEHIGNNDYINGQPTFSYIVLNGFYYKKTDEELPLEQLGEQIGEVKRIGGWEIKKSGDSNEITPGPIFSIKGRNEDYIAGKGVVFKEGKNMEGYLVFKKADKVKESNTNNILNAKGDSEENLIAFQNVKKKVSTLYGFTNIDSRVNLNLVSYSEGPIVTLYYGLPEGDKRDENLIIPGEIFIYQYDKKVKLENSRFLNPMRKYNRDENGKITMRQDENDKKTMKQDDSNWENPVKIESFQMNGIKWGVYKDINFNDYVFKGQAGNYYIEATTQGNISIDKMKNLLIFYKEIH